MKPAAYIRVSTKDQDYESQRGAVSDWFARTGVPASDVRFFADTSTGDNLRRPELEKLRAAIAAGEVDTVVIWKLDRLSRSLRDGLNLVADWAEAGVRVVSVTQQIDFSGTVGRMLAAVLLGFAQIEQETRRERQRLGIEQAKKGGVYLGRKPGSVKVREGPAKAMRLRAHNPTLTTGQLATLVGVSRATVKRYLAKSKA